MRIEVPWKLIPTWVLGVMQNAEIDGDKKTISINIYDIEIIEYLKR